MHSLQSDDFSTEFLSGFRCSSFLCYQNTRKIFLTTLSFVERFELGPLSKECTFIRGSFWSLELLFSGQQRLQDIRGRASVPRIAFFGSAVPSSYSRPGFDPANCLFRPSNAFKVFELKLRTFESSFSSLQRHHAIRV
jgi:hypothetical protein